MYLGGKVWKHVYAVPCNGIQECADECSDESNCQFPPWVLPCTLAGTIIVLFSTLLFNLWNFLNDVIRDVTGAIPQTTENRHYGCHKLFHIASSVEKEDVKEIRMIYDKEIVIHGNEAIAICCLKVHSMQNSTFSYLIQLPRQYL